MFFFFFSVFLLEIFVDLLDFIMLLCISWDNMHVSKVVLLDAAISGALVFRELQQDSDLFVHLSHGSRKYFFYYYFRVWARVIKMVSIMMGGVIKLNIFQNQLEKETGLRYQV